MKIIWIALLTTFFVSCGPSEFEYINAQDKDEALDNAIVAGQPQAQVSNDFKFEANPNPARVGQSVTFVASCKLGEGKIVTFDFGDSSEKQQGMTLQHAYQKEGTYLVQATCSTDGQAPLKATATIQVSNDRGPAQM